ncbi:MAG: hypothetical protein HZB61_10060 [Nitrospirae bacterium]|nr:hypothetical protein [Nitrospirota bacterium]
MNFRVSNIVDIIKIIIQQPRIRNKVIIRIMPYAVTFAVIVIYFFLHHATISSHLVDLSHLTTPDSAGNIIKLPGDSAEATKLVENIKLIKNETDTEGLFTIFIVIAITVVLLVETMYASIGIAMMDELIDFADRIAKGNLTQADIVINHKHMKKLGGALNNMKQELAEVTQRVSCATHKITDFSDDLFACSDVIAKDTKEQISNTAKVASAVEMMSVVVFDVTRNSSMAARSAKEASELAAKGGGVVAETINGMNRISRSVNESANTIEALGKRSRQIGEIIKVIDDIANQTNLLALNAAIEAARAGEQGRGFAVVADEVRKLAERTTSATGEISGMIKSIQQETQNAVSSMHSATKEVESGVNMANQADDSLKQIVASVQDVMDMVQQIDVAAKQQSSTGEDVSTNLQEISNENQRTAEVAQKYHGMTKALGDISQELQTLISHFNICRGTSEVQAVNCRKKTTNIAMFNERKSYINPS